MWNRTNVFAKTARQVDVSFPLTFYHIMFRSMHKSTITVRDASEECENKEVVSAWRKMAFIRQHVFPSCCVR